MLIWLYKNTSLAMWIFALSMICLFIVGSIVHKLHWLVVGIQYKLKLSSRLAFMLWINIRLNFYEYVAKLLTKCSIAQFIIFSLTGTNSSLTILIPADDLPKYFKLFDYLVILFALFCLRVVIYGVYHSYRLYQQGLLKVFIINRRKSIFYTWFNPFNAAALVIFTVGAHYIWPSGPYHVHDWNIIYIISLYAIIGVSLFILVQPSDNRFYLMVILQYLVVLILIIYSNWALILIFLGSLTVISMLPGQVPNLNKDIIETQVQKRATYFTPLQAFGTYRKVAHGPKMDVLKRCHETHRFGTDAAIGAGIYSSLSTMEAARKLGSNAIKTAGSTMTVTVNKRSWFGSHTTVSATFDPRNPNHHKRLGELPHLGMWKIGGGARMAAVGVGIKVIMKVGASVGGAISADQILSEYPRSTRENKDKDDEKKSS